MAFSLLVQMQEFFYEDTQPSEGDEFLVTLKKEIKVRGLDRSKSAREILNLAQDLESLIQEQEQFKKIAWGHFYFIAVLALASRFAIQALSLQSILFELNDVLLIPGTVLLSWYLLRSAIKAKPIIWAWGNESAGLTQVFKNWLCVMTLDFSTNVKVAEDFDLFWDRSVYLEMTTGIDRSQERESFGVNWALSQTRRDRYRFHKYIQMFPMLVLVLAVLLGFGACFEPLVLYFSETSF